MTEKLKLFKVRVDSKFTYFDNKVKAKEFRSHNPGSHVSRGPDNPKHGNHHHYRDNKKRGNL